jgi:hypothetical protein
MRVPAAYLQGEGQHTLEIERDAAPFDRPTLLNAVALPVGELRSTPQELRFTAEGPAHTSLKLYAPTQPRVELDGQPVPCAWNEGTCIAWCDTRLNAGQEVRIASPEGP